MTEGALLEASHLAKVYRLGGRTIDALRDVSLSVLPGQVIAVTGYSGSGKSTLLGVLGGLDRPTSGEITFAGKAYGAMTETQLGVLRRKEIAFIFQSFNLLPALSAFENVLLSARISGLPWRQARLRTDELLERVGMSERRSHRPAQLSGGEEQRVAIARALVSRPSLLLADEPTGDLDSANGAVVTDLLLELCRTNGSSCVVATHNLELAGRADVNLALKDGALLDGGLSHVG